MIPGGQPPIQQLTETEIEKVNGLILVDLFTASPPP